MVLNTSTSGDDSASEVDFDVGRDIKQHIDNSKHFKKLYDGTLRNKLMANNLISEEILRKEIRTDTKKE